MATLTANGFTLTEVAKRQHNGAMLPIAEVLEKAIEIMDDVPWIESNDIWSNVGLRRTSLPAGSFRKFNMGIATEKSDTEQVRDVIGLLESRSEQDIEIINSFANPQQARNDEDQAFAMGLAQTMASKILYANTATDPEQFTGLAPRMASLATTTNVLNEGGSGSDLTSIFVVDWSPTTAFMTYPRNSMAGLRMDDLGIETVIDTGGTNKFRAYVTHFVWKAGLVIKNPRSIGRIANIESTGTTNIFDEDNLITLLNRMTKGPGLRIYCNENVLTQAQIRLKDKTNVNWSVEQGLSGVPFMSFAGVPVRKIDSQILLNTEAALT
jgi:hypothetical protein